MAGMLRAGLMLGHPCIQMILAQTEQLSPGCVLLPRHAGDTLGNIALLDIHGKEIWERHVKSMLGQVRLILSMCAWGWILTLRQLPHFSSAYQHVLHNTGCMHGIRTSNGDLQTCSRCLLSCM